MRDAQRQHFDRLLEDVLAALPPRIVQLLEEAPLIVEDHPSRELLEELGMGDEDEDVLCGLHTGTALTERSVDRLPDLPDVIHIFRRGIIEHAGGWERWRDDDGLWWGGAEKISAEIRITILHEIGHHFGLDEQDLERLGYG